MSETAKINHLGFIVDGNRRWARDRGLSTYDGHKRGYEVLKNIAYAARERGISYVSAYTFSTENWKRSKEEVGYLMDLFLWAFNHDMGKMVRDGFRIVFLGSRENLSAKVIKAIEKTERDSAENTSCTLALCFNYGGQMEIADACRKIVESGIPADEITEETVAKNLYHADIPAIDMMVRSSGEMRLSNFMLWRVAYAELMFIDKKWPDMTADDLGDIIAEFDSRQRRFGK